MNEHTSEPNISRRKSRIVIPKTNPVFPSRCISTNSTDDLIWIDGNLDALANPALAKKVLPVLAGGMAIAGVAGGASRATSTLRRLPENLGRVEVPNVRFAVTRQIYENWLANYTVSNRRFKQLIIIGVLMIVTSVPLMIALAINGIGGQAAPVILGMIMMLGFLLVFLGGVFAVIHVQPLLHGLEIGHDSVTVKGAGPQFLNSLPTV